MYDVMALDSDLVGIIVGSAVVGVFLCVLVVVVSCLCYRRLESKRRKQEESKRGNPAIEWPPRQAFPPHFVPDGDVTFDTSRRIDGYRPRILSSSSPGGSTMFKTDSSQRPEGHMKDTPFHQMAYYPHPHCVKPMPPMVNGAGPPNGCVLVRIPVTRFGTPTETQDFYDARAWQFQQQSENFLQAGYYPDQVYQTATKSHLESPSELEEQVLSDERRQSQENDHFQQRDQNPDEQLTDVLVAGGPSEVIGQVVEDQHTTEDLSAKTQSLKQQETPQNEGHDPRERHKSISDEGSVNSNKCKVIKKHHNHVKMPDWLVQEYEETGKTINMQAEANTPTHNEDPHKGQTAINGVQGMVSVMVRDYTSAQEHKPSEEEDDTHGASMSTMDEGTTSIIHDYSSTNMIKDFTITDYVDPLPVDKNASKVLAEVHKKQVIEASIRQNKAAVLKQIREKVNESAERTPPVFTSTPRVEEENIPSPDQSHDEVINTGQSNEKSQSHKRQRRCLDGSVDILPPAAGDTRF